LVILKNKEEKMKKYAIVFTVLMVAMIVGIGIQISGCGSSGNLPVTTTTSSTVTTTPTSSTSSTTGITIFSLTSSAFISGQLIPNKYADTGSGIPGAANISVPLSWSNPPEGTVGYALVMLDTEHPLNPEVHWMVINIPSSVSSLAEGASPSSIPGDEIVHYEGPNPPETETHLYTFNLWALREPLDTASITGDWDNFSSAISSVFIETTSLIGTFVW
jgi:Raf kinase inhibitor-like YbhB/YbcL family protein